MKSKSYVYLAGPIRINDDFSFLEYDVKWRDEVIEHYKKLDSVYFYNPININLVEYCKNNKLEYLDTKTLNYAFINDMRMINSSDLCIANLISLSRDNYPCFGTISEIGMFVQNKKEVIVLCEEEVKRRLVTNPMFISCKLCTSLDDVFCELDKLLNKCNKKVNNDENYVFDALTEFEDPFLQNKYCVDHFDDDIIIIHNTKLRIQTVYKALYRRKI